MAETASKAALQILRDNRGDFETVLNNHLLGHNGPTTLNREFSGNELFFRKIFYGFTEIYKSFEILQDVEVYLETFPFAKSSVTKERYLRQHVEAYLHEIYILKERLLSYLKIIQRQYRGTIKESVTKQKATVITDLVNNSLSGLIETRGSHVHHARFSDKYLDRLASLELLARFGDEPDFVTHYDIAYQDARRHWIDIIQRNKSALSDLLDLYFAGIHDIIFNEKGELNYPR